MKKVSFFHYLLCFHLAFFILSSFANMGSPPFHYVSYRSLWMWSFWYTITKSLLFFILFSNFIHQCDNWFYGSFSPFIKKEQIMWSMLDFEWWCYIKPTGIINVIVNTKGFFVIFTTMQTLRMDWVSESTQYTKRMTFNPCRIYYKMLLLDLDQHHKDN